jgi:hypothetical protein
MKKLILLLTVLLQKKDQSYISLMISIDSHWLQLCLFFKKIRTKKKNTNRFFKKELLTTGIEPVTSGLLDQHSTD